MRIKLCDFLVYEEFASGQTARRVNSFVVIKLFGDFKLFAVLAYFAKLTHVH